MAIVTPIKQRQFSPDIVRQGTPHRFAQQILAADGAVTLIEGEVFCTKGTALAATIAAPPVAMDGARLILISTTAAAHVFTSGTVGFNAKGSSGTITFTAAIGNAAFLIAYQGNWYTLALINATVA